MKIFDQIYGEYELPEYVGAVAQTDLCVRARKLTQDSVPNYLLTRGPVPSRFEHGLGVAHLADIVVRCNPGLEKYAKELIIASLLHDAGNPPCSHLFENLLEARSGHRGESHLGELLRGSETEQVMKAYGINADLVVKIVTGTSKPLSDVLSGSMDLDNIDNTARHTHHTGGTSFHDPEILAAAFLYSEQGWRLQPGSETLVQQWRATRRFIYGWLNSDQHALVCAMVYRAAEMLFSTGKLPAGFFRYHDTEAVEYLSTCGEPGVEKLMHAALSWNWYSLAYVKTYATEVPVALASIGEDWAMRKKVSDAIASAWKLAPEQICLEAVWGKSDRQVTIPILHSDGTEMLDTEPSQDTFRFRVWTDPSVNIHKDDITKVIHDTLGLV
mgnify:CR=1 FL=1